MAEKVDTTPEPKDTPKPKLTDKDVMRGGPQVDPEPAPPKDTPPAPPKVVKLKLDGKEYEVAPELHEAVEKYRRELNERDGRRGSELEGLRKTLAELQETVKSPVKSPPDPTPKPKGPRPPDPMMMLTDPEKFLQQFTEYLDERERLKTDELSQRYQTAEEQRAAKEENRRAWDKAVANFYKDNPDLAGEEDLVDLVWRANYNDLKDLPLAKGFERIAQLTRERITRLSTKGQRKSPEDTPPPLLESGSPKPAPTPKKTVDDAVGGTLSDLIRRRQRLMRGEKA